MHIYTYIYIYIYIYITEKSDAYSKHVLFWQLHALSRPCQAAVRQICEKRLTYLKTDLQKRRRHIIGSSALFLSHIELGFQRQWIAIGLFRTSLFKYIGLIYRALFKEISLPPAQQRALWQPHETQRHHRVSRSPCNYIGLFPSI